MTKVDEKKLELESRLFAILGQPTRLRLLYMLRDRELCVCKINPAMREDQSVISRHLGKLRDMGLLASRKEGVSVYYSIAEPAVFELLENANGLLRTIVERQAREAVEAL
ncbi:metalloregulator ArsR/SmtB family transcription factor [bacterium]|nr:metalloregulator ArsR/SmtB family transcription factor [bacterium]